MYEIPSRGAAILSFVKCVVLWTSWLVSRSSNERPRASKNDGQRLRGGAAEHDQQRAKPG